MKASQYTTLTEGLNSLTLEIKVHQTADPSGFRAVYDSMLAYRDDFVSENQDRADRKVGVSHDGQLLFDAMGRFLNAIDTPFGKGESFYCFEICRMCQEWRGRMTQWFPILNNPGSPATGPDHTRAATKQFMADVVKTEAYTPAVKDGAITRPFTWNGTLRGLVDFLNDCQALPFSTDRNGNRHPRWSVANNVFTWNGTPVPGRKLSDTNQHMPKD